MLSITIVSSQKDSIKTTIPDFRTITNPEHGFTEF
jgi:hypothetical protein